MRDQPRGSGGRWVRSATEQLPAVGRRPSTEAQREHEYLMLHGPARFTAPAFRGLGKRVRQLTAGIEPGSRLYSELLAEANEYARGEAMLAAIDSFILGLGDRVIHKGARALYPIMKDRREMAAQLGESRERIARLKSAVDLEARLAALEDRRHG